MKYKVSTGEMKKELIWDLYCWLVEKGVTASLTDMTYLEVYSNDDYTWQVIQVMIRPYIDGWNKRDSK